jgi:hypothetical protein
MRHLSRFPRTARIAVAAASLLALAVGSGAGFKWG